jgi:electron transfer flavoprotein alpha subunit
MSGIKRVSPRRPYRLNAEGVRRIVLGAVPHGEGYAGTSEPRAARPKPVRSRQTASKWHMAIVCADRGGLDEPSRQAIAAAAILATPATGVLAVILGEFTGDAAALGADKTIILADALATYDPDCAAARCAELIAGYQPRHVFIADTPDGAGDIGRRLIARHDAAWATHVTEVGATSASIRWSAGAGLAQMPLPQFVLLESGAVDATLPFVGLGSTSRETSDAAEMRSQSRIRDLGLEALDASEVALEEADFIVSAGNGVGNVTLLKTLARELGAAVGASRVAVDDGKFARHQQIGATGKTVSATTYVAVGISGAVQHLQGIKDCRHVIAINRDASAPIVQRADLTIVGDAERVMRALLDLIRAARGLNSPGEAA